MSDQRPGSTQRTDPPALRPRRSTSPPQTRTQPPGPSSPSLVADRSVRVDGARPAPVCPRWSRCLPVRLLYMLSEWEPGKQPRCAPLTIKGVISSRGTELWANRRAGRGQRERGPGPGPGSGPGQVPSPRFTWVRLIISPTEPGPAFDESTDLWFWFCSVLGSGSDFVQTVVCFIH